MKPNSKRVITIFLAIVAAVLVIYFVKNNVGCVGGFPVLKKSKKEIEKKTIEQPPAQIKAYKTQRVSFRDTLPSLGTIKGFREFDLRFAVSGSVEYINFKEGEKITQEDIIASLNQKDALLKLEYAKIETEKQQKLFELGSITETKAKQSQLEYQSARSELEKTNLIALSDGYMGSVEVDKGSYVTPQDKIGTFVDIKDVYVEFGVIEKDVAKIREGQNVEVTVDSYPDQIFKGKVDAISPIVEGRSRTVKVRSKISNPDEKLKPGMFGRVNVLIYEKDQALIIPSSSFKKKEDQYFVYLIHPEESSGSMMSEEDGKPAVPPAEDSAESRPTLGTIEIRTIEISYATPDAIEIKEGIEEGDLVVVDVDQDLQDKSKVEITETQEGIF